MRHVLFKQNASYPIAILIKSTALREKDLRTEYVEHIVSQGIPENEVIAFSLEYGSGKTVSAADRKTYLSKLLPALVSLGTEYLVVADANYFKTLTGETKTDVHYGYVLKCAIKSFEHLNVIYAPNYQSFFYNPTLSEKRDMAINTLVSHYKGSHTPLGSDIIHSATYPETFSEVVSWLNKLHSYPMLACDIETFSLKFWKAGIATIAFAWDKHNGIAFPVDYKNGEYVDNVEIKRLLKEFFTTYTGKVIWHNGGFDMKIIIYELWMKPV